MTTKANEMDHNELNSKDLSSDKKLDLIISLLKGNELNKDDPGLIGRVRDHGLRINKMEKRWDKTIAWIIGFSFGGGVAVTELLKQFLSTKK